MTNRGNCHLTDTDRAKGVYCRSLHCKACNSHKLMNHDALPIETEETEEKCTWAELTAPENGWYKVNDKEAVYMLKGETKQFKVRYFLWEK